MIGARLVDVVDHRAQRRRLARAGGAGDEHQALVERAQLQDGGREAELLGRQNLLRDDAENRARALAIGKGIGAEAREAGDLVGEIGIVPLAEFLAVRLGHDRREQGRQIVLCQRRSCRVDRLDAAVLTNDRRRAHAQVKVGCAGGDHGVKECVDQMRSVAHDSGPRFTLIMSQVGVHIRSREDMWQTGGRYDVFGS